MKPIVRLRVGRNVESERADCSIVGKNLQGATNLTRKYPSPTPDVLVHGPNPLVETLRPSRQTYSTSERPI